MNDDEFDFFVDKSERPSWVDNILQNNIPVRCNTAECRNNPTDPHPPIGNPSVVSEIGTTMMFLAGVALVAALTLYKKYVK